MKNIFISGITGKVGKLLTDKILNDNFFHLTGGSCNENNNFLGSDVGDLMNQENLNIFITKDIPSKAEIDIIIDFSSPHASNLALQESLNRKIPILIGTTGLNEEQLKEMKIDYKIGKFSMMANSRAKAIDEAEGFVKILANAKNDKILGAHLIGPHAGELIAEIGVAMEFGASSEDIARTCHAHPTFSEAIKEAALSVDKRQIHS